MKIEAWLGCFKAAVATSELTVVVSEGDRSHSSATSSLPDSFHEKIGSYCRESLAPAGLSAKTGPPASFQFCKLLRSFQATSPTFFLACAELA